MLYAPLSMQRPKHFTSGAGLIVMLAVGDTISSKSVYRIIEVLLFFLRISSEIELKVSSSSEKNVWQLKPCSFRILSMSAIKVIALSVESAPSGHHHHKLLLPEFCLLLGLLFHIFQKFP